MSATDDRLPVCTVTVDSVIVSLAMMIAEVGPEVTANFLRELADDIERELEVAETAEGKKVLRERGAVLN